MRRHPQSFQIHTIQCLPLVHSDLKFLMPIISETLASPPVDKMGMGFLVPQSWQHRIFPWVKCFDICAEMASCVQGPLFPSPVSRSNTRFCLHKWTLCSQVIDLLSPPHLRNNWNRETRCRSRETVAHIFEMFLTGTVVFFFCPREMFGLFCRNIPHWKCSSPVS